MAFIKRHPDGLIVGLLWGAWHYLVALWGSGTPSGALALAVFLSALLFYVASLSAYRVLVVWVYDRTESLFLAMLMHASFSASMVIGIVAAARATPNGRQLSRPEGHGLKEVFQC